MRAVTTALIAAALLAPLACGSALAQGRLERARSPGVGPDGWVTAESRFGNGRVSGPVRRGRHGPEVRLPGGTWVHCVRSCSETLRRESIDFWQSHGNHAPDPGPGYFHWEFRF